MINRAYCPGLANRRNQMTESRRPTGRVLGSRVWPVVQGYDLVAEYYNEWYWQLFWEGNERPLIVRELKRVRSRASPALDAGTGTGMYLRELSRLGIRCTGLDTSQAMLDQARQMLEAPISLIRGSVDRLPFVDRAFNLVTACRVLSHVRDLGHAMKELGRVTRPEGRLIVSDLSAAHDYSETRIPIPDGDVHIETYKHSVEQLVNEARRSGYWHVRRFRSVAYKDLAWRPEPNAYPAIDATSARPVFYYAILARVVAPLERKRGRYV